MSGDQKAGEMVIINAKYVEEKVGNLAAHKDLSEFILRESNPYLNRESFASEKEKRDIFLGLSNKN
ncbi:MAG: hypothetical protein LBF44_01270, partial [Holosporaceae bacterium]|nr:hypothetical protein [Holosporaceae bacterium]